MKVEAKLVTIGTKPKPDWVGKNSTMVVKFSVAENHNRNVGTMTKPQWETYAVSWFNLEAWGDVAQEVLDSGLDVGDAIQFSGWHTIDKVQKENEKPAYYPKYKIAEFSVYE